MSDDVKDRAHKASAQSERGDPAHWALLADISASKLAGICAWAKWTSQSQITEAEFKRVSKQWLGHAPGSGKRPKEVK